MDMVAMLEILGYHSTSLARYWNVNVNVAGSAVAHLGSNEQKEAILPKLAEGKMFLSFGLSENQSGSDASSLKSFAVRDGDELVINGTKMWITGPMQANYVLTAVRTEKAQRKQEGISLVLIPPSTPGVTLRALDLLGGHMIPSCEVNMVDARVPASLLLGKGGEGWQHLVKMLAKERTSLAAIAVGGAQSAVDLAVGYAQERKQFDKSISSFQAISHMLVNMQTQVDAARLMAFRAARVLAAGMPCNQESAQAKVFATDVYQRVATDGLQIMGANGYSMEYAMQRHFRESKAFQIFGGTNQILRNVAGRELLT